MQVILLEKIGKLGNLGDQVNVKSGYGRNFLIPFGKAVPATKSNVTDFEVRRAELEATAVEKRSLAEARAVKLAELTVTIGANAGDGVSCSVLSVHAILLMQFLLQALT